MINQSCKECFGNYQTAGNYYYRRYLAGSTHTTQPRAEKNKQQKKRSSQSVLCLTWKPSSDHHIVSRPTRPANMEIALKKLSIIFKGLLNISPVLLDSE